VLSPDDLAAVAAQFGVADSQVRRDHLISHLLAALTRTLSDEVLFFGGTALSRTFLTDMRLSEDIDLIARGRRRDVAAEIERVVPRLLRREFPGLYWDPQLTALRDVEPAVLRSSDGTVVRVQLLAASGYPAWPTNYLELEQRYEDAPPARLRVPTRPAFAAWKTVAWADRAASRDLFDLWALARVNGIDSEAAQLFVRHGPTNRPPAPSIFEKAPDETSWQRDLSGQTRLTVSAAEAMEAVRWAWGAVV
jgi:predicted nucleotidyltransferase component of viral defense system